MYEKQTLNMSRVDCCCRFFSDTGMDGGWRIWAADDGWRVYLLVEGWEMLRTPLPTNLGFLYRSLNPRRKKAEYGPRKKGAKDMGYSQLVTHPSTNPARPGLTSVILFLLLLSCQMYTSAMEETKQRSWTFPNGTLMDGCVFARGLCDHHRKI